MLVKVLFSKGWRQSWCVRQEHGGLGIPARNNKQAGCSNCIFLSLDTPKFTSRNKRRSNLLLTKSASLPTHIPCLLKTEKKNENYTRISALGSGNPSPWNRQAEMGPCVNSSCRSVCATVRTPHPTGHRMTRVRMARRITV